MIHTVKRFAEIHEWLYGSSGSQLSSDQTILEYHPKIAIERALRKKRGTD